MNLTNLMENPYFSLGTSILAQQQGGLGAYGKGIQNFQNQNRINDQQSQARELQALQIQQAQRTLNTPTDRKTVQVNGIPYYQDTGAPVVAGSKPKPDTNIEKLMAALKAYPVGSPERGIIQAQIDKLNYTSPIKETMVKVVTPTGVKYVPQSQAAGQEAYTSNTSLTIDPETGAISFSQGGSAGLGMTNTGKNKSHDAIKTALSQINSLNKVAENYAADYLTYEGSLKAWAGGVGDKLGLDNELVSFNADRSAFIKNVKQLFNEYRRYVTGAAASEKEMKDLLASILNSSTGPKQFITDYKQFMQNATDNIGLHSELLGIDIADLNVDSTGHKGLDIMREAEEYLNGQ